MNERRDKGQLTSGESHDVESFLRQVAATPPPRPGGSGGRLLFAIDATASRQPTWDTACQIQGEMFSETSALGGLAVQLCYYRGFRELRASDWVRDSASLVPLMTAVSCLGGHTQIARVLRHALAEHRREPLQAVIFVGDCMEESVDDLCALAGQLGLLNVPLFIFHEGPDPIAARAFRQMAQLSGGACCRFDSASADQLKALLGAVAVYAAGGRRALEDYGRRHRGALRLLTQQVDARR